MASWKKLVQQNRVAMVTGSFSGSAHISGSLYGKATTVIDDGIDSDQIAAGAIDLAHMSSQAVDEDNLYISNAGSNGQFLSLQSGNNGGLTWATPAGGGGAGIFTQTGSYYGTTNNIMVTGSITASQGFSGSCETTSSFGSIRLCGSLILGSGGIIRDYGGNTGITVGTGTTGVISVLTTRAVQFGGGYTGGSGTTIDAGGNISANGTATLTTAVVIGSGYDEELAADSTGTFIKSTTGLSTNSPITASNGTVGIAFQNAYITPDGEIVTRAKSGEEGEDKKTKEVKAVDGTVNLDEVTKEDGSEHTIDVKRGEFINKAYTNFKVKTGASATQRFEITSTGIMKLGDVSAVLPLAEMTTRKETRTVYASDGGVF